MKLYAVLADIHGNFTALQAVVADALAAARAEGCPDDVTFISLGDVVDYGPQPEACVAWVRDHAHLAVQGNHDREVADEPYPPNAINQDYWPAALWTRQVLSSSDKETLRRWPERIEAAPALPDFTCFHSSLIGTDDPIMTPEVAARNMQQQATPYGMYGHTHLQGWFLEGIDTVTLGLACTAAEAEQVRPRKQSTWQSVLVGQWHRLPPPWQRVLLNPGSIGQPRQHSLLLGAGLTRYSQASYLLLRLHEEQQDDSPGDLQFRRVDYDVAQTIALLRSRFAALPALDMPLPPEGYAGRPYMLDTLAHLQERLPRLAEEVFIPKLLPGGRS